MSVKKKKREQIDGAQIALDTILWCACLLGNKGYPNAAKELLRHVPAEKADERLAVLN